MCLRVIMLHYDVALVSHPNLYAFLRHPQNTTVNSMSDGLASVTVSRFSVRNSKQTCWMKPALRHVSPDLTTEVKSGFSSCVLSATLSERTPNHYSPIQMVTAQTMTRIRCRRRQLLADRPPFFIGAPCIVHDRWRHLNLHLPLCHLGLLSNCRSWQQSKLSRVLIMHNGYNGTQIYHRNANRQLNSPNQHRYWHPTLANATL